MGFRFRKTFKLGKYLNLNLSKSGFGASIGNKFFRIGKTAKGKVRKTVTLPGTGLSHISETDPKNHTESKSIINKKNLKEKSFNDIIDDIADKIDGEE